VAKFQENDISKMG